MKKVITRVFLVVIIIYSVICVAMFGLQEKLIFFPEKLTDDYAFHFDHPFKEITVESKTGNHIHGLFFKSDSAKGVIVYFHGNAGSLRTWGDVFNDFIPLHYDLLITDYAGYGKSKGKISEQNLFDDAQAVYDFAKTMYAGPQIIIYGRSIGTGIAAHLAKENNPRMLILESPYYNLKDMTRHFYPWLPVFLLRYPFRTDLFLPQVKCPVTIFHGTDDGVIYFGSCLKLKKLFKPGDQLFTITGGHHNDLKTFDEYRNGLRKVLL